MQKTELFGGRTAFHRREYLVHQAEGYRINLRSDHLNEDQRARVWPTYLGCSRRAGDYACTGLRAEPMWGTCKQQHNAPCRFSLIAEPEASSLWAICRLLPLAMARKF